MEGRLDDLLSRIAMETQEIRELEQQLTDGEEKPDQSERAFRDRGLSDWLLDSSGVRPAGQILANEALQRDLQEVICGLQEYLRGLRLQVCRWAQTMHRYRKPEAPRS